jgi:hypothetical protein
LFDEYARESSDKFGVGIDQESITKLCQSINREVDYKQKSVIMLELMSLILADGDITPSEENLAKSIGQAFNVSSQDIELIKIFIVSKIPELIDNENILVVSNEGKSGSFFLPLLGSFGCLSEWCASKTGQYQCAGHGQHYAMECC